MPKHYGHERERYGNPDRGARRRPAAQDRVETNDCPAREGPWPRWPPRRLSSPLSLSVDEWTDPIELVSKYRAYRVINPAADATTLDLTISVPRAPSRTLRFVGPDGRPVRGVRVRGLVAPPCSMTVVLDGSEAKVLALEPGKSREVIVISNDGKYTATTFVGTDDPQPPDDPPRNRSVGVRALTSNTPPSFASPGRVERLRMGDRQRQGRVARVHALGRFC